MNTILPQRRNGSIAILMRKLLDVECFTQSFLDREMVTQTFCTHEPEMFEAFFTRASVSVALIDMELPDNGGLELGRRILDSHPACSLVFLDRDFRIFRSRLAEDLGALYCCRDLRLVDLTDILVQLAQFGRLDESTAESLASRRKFLRFDDQHVQNLTRREVQVWSLIAQGYSVSHSARELSLSESTVDNHKSRLMKKLDIHKSVELVHLAYKTGLIE